MAIPKVNRKPRIVILGGGFGGLYTALALYWRGACLSADITLVDRESHFLFTPLLYELLTGEVDQWQIAPEFREILPTTIDFVQGEVESVDTVAREVRFSNSGSISFDGLVLSLGSNNAYLGIEGAADNSIPFRTISDACELDCRLKKLSNGTDGPVSILGAGPSGVELAAKISDFLLETGRRSRRLRLIDRSRDILPGYAGELREHAWTRLKNLGVEFRLGAAVQKITADSIELADGTQLPSTLNIWTAGSSPSTVLQTVGCLLDRRGRIPVGPSLEVPGHPGMFALGDDANAGDEIPATAQVAVRQAQVAANNLQAWLAGRPYREYHHAALGEMLSLGRGVAAANLFGVKFDGSTGNFVRKFIYLLSLPSPAHALRVGVSWAGNAVNEFSRLLTE
jgi:NADH dehydrogenase